MSDLRERFEQRVSAEFEPGFVEMSQAIERAWPIVEAELQKRDRLRDQINDAYVRTEDALTEANQLLEQTIEVLEAAPEVDNAGRECCEDCDWWLDKAKPLLDNLKALKKEAGNGG